MRRPTFAEIAASAGVSLATAERVLNGRGGVSRSKVQQVITAAQQLGYDRRLPDIHQGIVRVEIILARPETDFYRRLADMFEQLAHTLNAKVSLHRTVMGEDPGAFAARLLGSDLRRAGLIVAGPDHPAVRDALNRVRAEGTHVIQIVSRALGVEGDYVGIDNYSAGRSAAMYMARMSGAAGTVVALCPGGQVEAHRERIRGFSDYFQAHPAAGLDFDLLLFTRDESATSAAALQDCLDERPEVVGLYNTGGHNAVLCKVLRGHPRGPKVFFVGHELNARSAEALRIGVMQVVLDQSPEIQAQRALDLMMHRMGLTARPVANPPIRFITVTAENL